MSTEHTLLNLMTDGGWVMWALLALSLASLAVALERSWVLHRARSPVAELAAALRRNLGSAGSTAAALDAVQRVDGSARRVLAAGLAVAVPVHLVHGLLSSRVSRIASEVEDLAHLLLELREREDVAADSPRIAAPTR